MSIIILDAKKPLGYAIHYTMELQPDMACLTENPSKRTFSSFVSPSHFLTPKTDRTNYFWVWYHILNGNLRNTNPIQAIFPSTFKNRILFDKECYDKLDILNIFNGVSNLDDFEGFSSSILMFKEKEEATKFLHNRIFEGTYLSRFVSLCIDNETAFMYKDRGEEERKLWEHILRKDSIVTPEQVIIAQTGYCELIGWLPEEFRRDMESQIIINEEISDFVRSDEYTYISGTFFETYTIKSLALNPNLSKEIWKVY